ncbi:S8 family peptidase [Pseudoalteromonas denitrificans]|uniref:Subtilase family protein n=1 Tax=Pseudoalteromonas denitrificans DSM 6059 TaxID=1123010 RepID=A0A1I1Q1N6_9GAMM|nr:S8 family serine peptidase [Pseudoalteromonas denitrificans]SFD15925.1 Subtilase family protein [Pseudoalteromonas denitrificans DSM 6059]
MSTKLVGAIFFICFIASTNCFAESFTFLNLNEQIKLNKIAHSTYQVDAKNLNIRISNRLIIKSKHFLTSEEITHLAPQLSRQITLFKLSTQAYYLLEFETTDSALSALTLLQVHPQISLVQPDLLQLNLTSPKSLIKENVSKFKPENLTHFITLNDIKKMKENNQGENVKVAIIDDGIDTSIPELQRVEQIFNYDFNANNKDENLQFGHHGTQVASTIFSTLQKNMGIAPRAQLISIRQLDTWTSTTLLSFYMAQAAGADIINASWNSRILLEPIKDIVNYLAINGRDAKGIPVVFSAGNSGQKIEPNRLESSLKKAIIVGAINKNNQKLPLSNYGGSVDLYAPGWAVNVIKLKPNTLFGATSRAAAITSGYIALMLSENADLTLKQISNTLGAH